MRQRDPTTEVRIAALTRALLIVAVGCAAACTSTLPVVDEAVPEQLPDEPVTVMEPEIVAELPEQPVPDEQPVEEVTEIRRILVLRSSDAASYTEVADALDELLAGRYELQDVNYDELDAAGISAVANTDVAAAVAIGLDAATFAATKLALPTVVCQVFDPEPLVSQRDAVFGVAALPPPALQLQAWKRLAPTVASAGIIVSQSDRAFVTEAKQAAADAGIALRVEFASSDRELLYRFKRLAPELDGFWLFPDNKILSPSVLHEIFDYALVHKVHSIVFNPSLLNWGALLSVGGSSDNVAATVATVLDAVVDGSSSELRRVTPLSAVDARVNEEIAGSLGLPDATTGFGLEAAAH